MDLPPPPVCILPYRHAKGLRLARVRLAEMDWPLGRPEGLGDRTLADLAPTDHLIAPPRAALVLGLTQATTARVSVMVLEPRAIHGKYLVLLRRFHRRFHRILTGDRQLLDAVPNAVRFPVGGSWVPEWPGLDVAKTRMCSLIASAKRRLPGHALRHEMVSWVRGTGQDVEVMGHGYRSFAAKSEGLAAYRYSVVIENSQEENYFTEKLVDAMLCKTVPIYWGCPNIGDYFDVRGMILCRSAAEIRTAVGAMSVQGYDDRLPLLEANRAVAAGYGDIYDRAARAVLAAT
jgi:hypothetical protein